MSVPADSGRQSTEVLPPILWATGKTVGACCFGLYRLERPEWPMCRPGCGYGLHTRQTRDHRNGLASFCLALVDHCGQHYKIFESSIYRLLLIRRVLCLHRCSAQKE